MSPSCRPTASRRAARLHGGPEGDRCGCPVVVTDQVPEIVRRFPAVPAVAPYDAEDFRRRIDVALDGRPQPADNTSMADYDWSTVARRYVDLYQSVLRPPGVVGVSCIRVKDAI